LIFNTIIFATREGDLVLNGLALLYGVDDLMGRGASVSQRKQ